MHLGIWALLILSMVIVVCQGQNKQVFCYFSNWSQYRAGRQFRVSNINTSYCTHLLYAFAFINTQTDDLKLVEWNDEALYEDFNALKASSPGLKTLLACGGYTFGSGPFSAVAASATRRQTFANNVVAWLRRYNFDGLDIDWEYPNDPQQGGTQADFVNYILFLQALRDAFDKETLSQGQDKLLLTAAVAVGFSKVAAGYDVAKINQVLDFIGLMSYDLHGSWEPFTGHHTGLYAHSVDEDNLSVAATSLNWINKGASPNKTLVGLATYAKTFTTRSTTDHSVGAAAIGGGTAGPYTKASGTLAYYEVCQKISQGYTSVFDQQMKAPYAYSGNQWIGYDNELSIQYKLDWMNKNGFGGAIVWVLDMDDFDGALCGNGAYPIMRTISNCLMKNTGCSPSDGGTIAPVTTTLFPPTVPTTLSTTPRTSTVRTTRRWWTPRRPTTPLRTTTPKPVPSPPGDYKCPGSGYGFYPDPMDCRRFYVCWNRYSWNYACAPGTSFNYRRLRNYDAVCVYNSQCRPPYIITGR